MTLKNEINNRIEAVRSNGEGNQLDPEIVPSLKEMFDEHNPYCQAHRMARDRIRFIPAENYTLKLLCERQEDGRIYNLPTSNQVAALIAGSKLGLMGTNNYVVWRLFQQYVVDAYTMVETDRLSYIRTHQKEPRGVKYGNLDELKAGYPNLFVTFTCNQAWPAIARFLSSSSRKAEDRPDIVRRIFKVKLDQLVVDFKKNKLFGTVIGDIDKIIIAEIPNKQSDPELYHARRYAIGRLHYVPPSMGKLFYLRILLYIVLGPNADDAIRTVDGKVYATYRVACFARGLLQNDKEYIDAIRDAVFWGNGQY
ncbi:hypothetical protein L6164_002688 [Bauhinia variegata]|uniref:Uncharacterized protein n=1 Tax=Bauhinia variegata TaxID=167791 RepID=A0ACB9PZJ8_BAUVA|nr:hypothetical protein L6164_002688 [Bauhinia variegata]